MNNKTLQPKEIGLMAVNGRPTVVSPIAGGSSVTISGFAELGPAACVRMNVGRTGLSYVEKIVIMSGTQRMLNMLTTLVEEWRADTFCMIVNDS